MLSAGHIVLVGECHGSRQIPWTVWLLCDAALSAGRRVALGLEMEVESDAESRVHESQAAIERLAAMQEAERLAASERGKALSGTPRVRAHDEPRGRSVRAQRGK